MRFHTFLRDDVTHCAAPASIKGAHLEHFSWVLSAPSRTVERQDRNVLSRASQTDGLRKIRSNKEPTYSGIQKCPHENKNNLYCNTEVWFCSGLDWWWNMLFWLNCLLKPVNRYALVKFTIDWHASIFKCPQISSQACCLQKGNSFLKSIESGWLLTQNVVHFPA